MKQDVMSEDTLRRGSKEIKRHRQTIRSALAKIIEALIAWEEEKTKWFSWFARLVS